MRSSSSNKESVLAITLLLLLLFLFTGKLYLIYVACIFIFACLLSNHVASFFHLVWSRITQALGFLSNTIILSIVFYGIVFPLGMIMKLLNKTPLVLKVGNRQSTFTNRNKTFTGKDLENPF